MLDKNRIELGIEVKDKVSGLIGIVTSRTEFLYGCMRLGVTPQEIKDGKPVEESVIDEPQLEIVSRGILSSIEKPKRITRNYGDPNFKPVKHSVSLRR